MTGRWQVVLNLEKHACYSPFDSLYSFAPFDPSPRLVIDDEHQTASRPAEDGKAPRLGTLRCAHESVSSVVCKV